MLPTACRSASATEDAALAGDLFFFNFLSCLRAALSVDRQLPARAPGHGVHVGPRYCSSSFSNIIFWH